MAKKNRNQPARQVRAAAPTTRITVPVERRQTTVSAAQAHAADDIDISGPPRQWEAMAIGTMLGAMVAWLICVIIFAAGTRTFMIPAPAMLIILIGAVIGLILGGFGGVMLRGNRRRPARRA